MPLYPYKLPDRVAATVKMTRAMGKDFLRPLGISADAQGHPHAPDHPFYQQVARMGFMERRLNLDGKNKSGSGGERWLARGAVAMLEEASYWDRGMAVSLPGPGLGGPPVMTLGTPDQKKRFLAPFMERDRPIWDDRARRGIGRCAHPNALPKRGRYLGAQRRQGLLFQLPEGGLGRGVCHD